jgi:hypothetical protein
MDVSIIICTHNGADALGGTLESLRRIDVPSGWDVELLLVDNACLGRSEAYISYQWEHRRWPIWKLSAGWVYYQIRLIVLNLQSKSAVPEGIDMSRKEFEVRRKMARIHQHLRERGTPPEYHKHGTMKKNGR